MNRQEENEVEEAGQWRYYVVLEKEDWERLMTRMKRGERKKRPRGREFHLQTSVVKEAIELPLCV